MSFAHTRRLSRLLVVYLVILVFGWLLPSMLIMQFLLFHKFEYILRYRGCGNLLADAVHYEKLLKSKKTAVRRFFMMIHIFCVRYTARVTLPERMQRVQA